VPVPRTLQHTAAAGQATGALHGRGGTALALAGSLAATLGHAVDPRTCRAEERFEHRRGGTCGYGEAVSIERRREAAQEVRQCSGGGRRNGWRRNGVVGHVQRSAFQTWTTAFKAGKLQWVLQLSEMTNIQPRSNACGGGGGGGDSRENRKKR
jgi:hypothetical protein